MLAFSNQGTDAPNKPGMGRSRRPALTWQGLHLLWRSSRGCTNGTGIHNTRGPRLLGRLAGPRDTEKPYIMQAKVTLAPHEDAPRNPIGEPGRRGLLCS